MTRMRYDRLRSTIERTVAFNAIESMGPITCAQISQTTGIEVMRLQNALRTLESLHFIVGTKAHLPDSTFHIKRTVLWRVPAAVVADLHQPVRIHKPHGAWRLDHALPVRSVFDMGVAA